MEDGQGGDGEGEDECRMVRQVEQKWKQVGSLFWSGMGSWVVKIPENKGLAG